MIPLWIQLGGMLINAIVELVKLIVELRKTNPQAASEMSAALSHARTQGDVEKLKDLIHRIQKNP